MDSFDKYRVDLTLEGVGFHRGSSMSGWYAYNPYIWPSIFTFLLLIALAIYSWRRRIVPGAVPFMLGCLFGALWAFTVAMEYAAVGPETKIFWYRFGAFFKLPVVIAVTCFVIEYAWPGRWLTRRNLALLSFPWFLEIALILTNDSYHWLWLNFRLENYSVVTQISVGAWLTAFYAFGVLGALNLIVFIWLFLHSPQHRWPVVFMLAGQVVGRMFFMLELADILQAKLPLGVMGMTFEFLMYAIALFGFQILDPIPLARRMVIEQMHAGMLVLDPLGKVVSLNSAAQSILCLPEKHLLKRPIQELLQVDDKILISGQTEIQLGNGQEVRYYQLETSSLTDWRGLEVGRLLLLHDVTMQKRTQEQILKQQRSVATLQERDRLAREMHDSLGQTLAASHLLAGTAKMLLGQGETAQAEKCMDQLSEMTMAAETDVREYILGARLTISAGQRFFEILRQYLVHFSQQYSLHVRLSIPPQLESQGLGTTVEVQLLRIIQEALTNIRKHAQAQSTQVIFTDSEHFVQIAIIDDGQGFDPAAVARQTQGFGLQAMRDRVEALGGCLEITSQPGQGTQVLVQIKREEEFREGTEVR